MSTRIPFKTLVMSALAIGLLTWPIKTLAASSADSTHNQLRQSIDIETQAQKSVNKWLDEKDQLTSELRDIKARDAWLAYQNEKYVKYISKQKETIAELERRKEEVRKIKMELEPFLDQIVDSLEEFVSADINFLQEERRNRIQFLRDSLDDYRLNLSEKFRRVLEALQVEAEYGRTVETTEATLEIDGNPTQVNVLRLGRTALFYQTLDGRLAGAWDRGSTNWKPIDPEYGRTLKKAREMAERKRAVDLLRLPVGEVK